MRILFVFFCFLFPLFSANLTDYNIYNRNDRVDLMLSFDSAYQGNISQRKDKKILELIFDNLKYSKSEIKNLQSKFIDKIAISSKNNKTFIMFHNKEEINLNVSSVNDKFGIRVRITPLNQSNIEELSKASSMPSSENFLTTKEKISQEYNYTNYILIVLALIILLIALLWLKKNMLYKKNIDIKNFNIIFQKPLDRNNQFMILEYNSKRYVMIIGQSNLLLESSEIPVDRMEKDFEDKNFNSFFEENKRKIQNLINEKTKSS
ncbi:hypothetical protein JG676_03840 [Campylobacter sp. 2018MI35]|uniref:hypothetical protein n=1 Tax=Campylobacter sp. 2018MI34 TaxID=2800582 RepID=UPI001905A128|nr:hypothetical protein [Campylobacter sp. 2018MI34]MBK1991730.1 hypothetical protein [Campylobacter sp. 2018MI34]